MADTSVLTVGIKTFLRTPQLALCLEALAAHSWRRVIVADDGPIDAEREAMYAAFSARLPLDLLRLEFDTGLSAGRNEIVRRCDSEYLLVLDDDQTVPANIGELREVLDENGHLGGVSCVWFERGARRCTACDIRRRGRYLIKATDGRKPVQSTRRGLRFVEFDFVPNSTLFRMDCLRDLAWDPFYKIGKEHLDFYLSHQALGKWRFAVCLDVEIGHHPEDNSPEYLQFRKGERLKVSERHFFDKFDVDDVIEGPKLIGNDSRLLAFLIRHEMPPALIKVAERLQG
ncbi:MAG: glycosyltransferase [Steroidobacteraceae bacterium]